MTKNIPRQLDSRVVERYIDKGFVKESELKAHLSQLPDDSNNLEWVSYDLEESEVDGAPSEVENSDNNP